MNSSSWNHGPMLLVNDSKIFNIFGLRIQFDRLLSFLPWVPYFHPLNLNPLRLMPHNMRFQDILPDVRQSAFALVGDLARACPAYLTPVLTQLVALSLANLETSAISHGTVSACNNACWSLGTLSRAPSGYRNVPVQCTRDKTIECYSGVHF